MSVLDDVKEVFHRVRVKLYPSHLEDLKGTFYARTANEKTLDYKEVCKMAKERGGYTGNLDDLEEDVAAFLRESAHQMCDGFAINFGGLFAASPRISGVLLNAHQPLDPEKNKIVIHFRPLHGLSKVTDRIEVVSEGLADTSGYITEITDVATGLVNDVVTKGGIFTLAGDKIRVTGDPAKTGVVFFLPGSPNVSIKAAGNLAVNDPSKIVGTVPELLAGKDWFIEVRTYFSGHGASPLKEMRTIRSTFTVKLA
jgi:hypothetical protein